MNITTIDKSSLDKEFENCDVNCIHVKIEDIKPVITNFQKQISDTSWISQLDELSQEIYQATVERTIDKIVNDIISKVTSTVNEEIGEYLVSYCAQMALEVEFDHIRIPLAELLKEQISGNPGFDFHTISHTRIMVFGEAKFSNEDTPRARALDQIGDFIRLKKDNAELNSFRPLMDEDVITNYTSGRKGYTGAFSFNAQNIMTIFNNALDSDAMEELIKYNELYLIAVEIC